MLRWLRDLLYGTTEIEIVSDYDLDESVRRLSAVTRRFMALTAQVAVGKVSVSRVRLRRSRPFFHNDFKPVFDGAFHQANGRVVLRGRFGLSIFTKVFMTFWLGFCAVWTLLAAFLTVGDAETWWLPLAGVGMFCFGTALVAGAKQWSKGDVEWLAGLVRETLGKSPLTTRWSGP